MMTATEVEKRRMTLAGRALLALLGVLIAMSLNVWFTIYYQQQQNHKWCSLMVSLDDRYQALPPSSDPAARQFAAQIHTLRNDLNCPTTRPKARPSGP